MRKLICRTCGQEVPADTAKAMVYSSAGLVLVDVEEPKPVVQQPKPKVMKPVEKPVEEVEEEEELSL